MRVLTLRMRGWSAAGLRWEYARPSRRPSPSATSGVSLRAWRADALQRTNLAAHSPAQHGRDGGLILRMPVATDGLRFGCPGRAK